MNNISSNNIKEKIDKNLENPSDIKKKKYQDLNNDREKQINSDYKIGENKDQNNFNLETNFENLKEDNELLNIKINKLKN